MREFLGLDNDTSWRFAMLVPAVMFFMVAATMKYCCWDMPDRKKFDPKVYKVNDPSLMDYCVCLADYKVAADRDEAERTPAPLSIWLRTFSFIIFLVTACSRIRRNTIRIDLAALSELQSIFLVERLGRPNWCAREGVCWAQEWPTKVSPRRISTRQSAGL